MPEFGYTDLLPLGADDTTYRLISAEGVTTRQAFGKTFTEIDPQVLTELTGAAMHDIAHLLRPGHLSQLRSILGDPEASPNDRYVARDLLKNACVAAGGVLPMCQDTGTAIVMAKRIQRRVLVPVVLSVRLIPVRAGGLPGWGLRPGCRLRAVWTLPPGWLLRRLARGAMHEPVRSGRPVRLSGRSAAERVLVRVPLTRGRFVSHAPPSVR